jgi:hypothetical protein
LRQFGNKIEKFLEEARGWYPRTLPKVIEGKISEVKAGALYPKSYA